MRPHQRFTRTRLVVRRTLAAAATITAVILGLVAPAAAGPQADEVRTELAAGQQTDADVNKSLDSMAKLFAAAVTDENLRQQIYDGAAQRFDGDTNVLYETLSNTSEVRQALATEYGRGRAVQPSDALSAVDRLASDIPRFQVAVPANFDAWDPASYTPLVAYMPVGVEDTTLKTVTAYDATGRAHELDAQVTPDQPVIVLGLNERTDDSGRLLKQEPEPVSSDPVGQAANGSVEPVDTSGDVVANPPTALLGNYDVEIAAVRLNNDKEPWARGAAEIAVDAESSCGDLAYYEPDFPYLNHDGDTFSWNTESNNLDLDDTSCDVVFVWWENDAQAPTITISYRGVSVEIKFGPSDDEIGKVLVDNEDFAGTSNEHTGNWNALDMWTE